MSTPQTPASVMRGGVDLSSLRNRPDPAAAQAAAAAPGGATVVIDVTDQTFPQVLELSRQVPVVVDLWAEWCGPCKQLSPALEKVTREYDGRVLLAKVDVDANPQLAQAFRAQSIPMVVALVGGQPVPMFTGAVPEAQVREVFAQLLELAAKHGVTGTLPGGEPDAAAEEPAVPPLHAEAFDAIEAGDYDRAISAYERALAENPKDDEAKAGLAQVELLKRVQGVDLQAARQAAADAPTDLAAQFLVADLDVAGGHVEDAFARLLELFEAVGPDDRPAIQQRLIGLFDLVGTSDPRVVAARTRLTSLLF